MTRAVAHLCLICSDFMHSVREMRRHWEVEIVEEESNRDRDKQQQAPPMLEQGAPWLTSSPRAEGRKTEEGTARSQWRIYTDDDDDSPRQILDRDVFRL